ncbi:MAG: nicotinate-nucleotide adenylyltransferase [Finegoldia sp.]|nr:nicotinate-nucleotide adenylyltransferase [Finegoldia sp.]
MKTKKIGIFGGTFDPIHLGHLAIAMEAVNEKGLDEVWFVPAGLPNFKQNKKLTDKADRLAMVELAIEGNDKFKVFDYEVKSDQVSYTYKTLDYIKQNYEGDFYLIVGEDSLMSIESWEKAETFLSNTKILVCSRNINSQRNIDKEIKRLKEKDYRVEKISFRNIDISSTFIRDRIREGFDVRYYLDNKVYRYIRDRGLYED